MFIFVKMDGKTTNATIFFKENEIIIIIVEEDEEDGVAEKKISKFLLYSSEEVEEESGNLLQYSWYTAKETLVYDFFQKRNGCERMVFSVFQRVTLIYAASSNDLRVKRNSLDQ